MRYLVLAACVLLPQVANAQYVTADHFSYELQRENLAATVRIKTDLGTGSGFILHHNIETGVASVLTAYHVVDSEPAWIRIERFHADSRWPAIRCTYTASILDFDEPRDVAILKFDAGTSRLPTLQVATRLPELPCRAFSVGCPKSVPPEISERQLNETVFVEYYHSELTASTTPGIGGQSGGPLVSHENGHVIGVHLMSRNNCAHFASLDAIQDLCDRVGLTACYLPSKGGPEKRTVWFIIAKIVGGMAIIVRFLWS